MRCQSCGLVQFDAPRCTQCQHDPHMPSPDLCRTSKVPVPVRGWIYAALIIAGLLVIWDVKRDVPPMSMIQRSVVTASPAQRGEEVRLAGEGFATVFLARDRGAFEELATAFLAANTKGYLPLVIAALTESGRLLVVEPNTQAVVLEADQMKTRVRIISGRDAGADGWVYSFQITRR